MNGWTRDSLVSHRGAIIEYTEKDTKNVKDN